MISLYITNATGNNKQVSPLGNSVTVQLGTKIKLDDKKKYHMRLLQSNIVYCSPNVFTDKNNKLHTNTRIHKQIHNHRKLLSLTKDYTALMILILKYLCTHQHWKVMDHYFILFLIAVHQKFI